ncbi:MAG: 4Fe-4S binding protein [bacterium]|nr:4Fe-4S binding protein [bacterium]
MIKLDRRLPQILRRATQCAVLFFIAFTAFGGLYRNYKMAHGQQRLVTLMEGPVWGALYGLYEKMLSVFGDPFEASDLLLGFPWSGRLFGLETVDPLLTASLAVRGIIPPSSLFLGLAIPVGIAFVFGKFFCSHLCPARLLFELGESVRRGLTRLGLELPEWSSPLRLGGWVLLGGLLATTFSSAAVWLLILPYASLGVGVHLWVAGGAPTVFFCVLVFWLAIDVLLAPGLFCKNLCPTGSLLEQFARFSRLRITKRIDASPCPNGCHVCKETCPYSLLPKDEMHDPSCDACGRCVEACPRERLQRRLMFPIVGLLAIAWLPGVADAHHNKGMPHYGYFENYAQVPSEEYLTIQGRWEMGATLFNFQGLDRRTADTPNDVKIYISLFDVEAGSGWEGLVDFSILHEGEPIAEFTREKVDEESVYSTRETIPESGDYELIARVDGDRISLPFHVDLAGEGLRWGPILVLSLFGLGLFGLALFGRTRRRSGRGHRRMGRT